MLGLVQAINNLASAIVGGALQVNDASNTATGTTSYVTAEVSPYTGT